MKPEGKHEKPVDRDSILRDNALLLSQCQVDVYRASGPGGQKRNKTSSAVRLRHTTTGLSALAEEDRSQHVNKRRALRRLREEVALSVRISIRPQAYKPSELLRGYIVNGTLRVNDRNDDFGPVVAEVFDVLAAVKMSVSESAECIGISTAQLVKFLQGSERVWRTVCEERAKLGLKPLRT